MNKRNLKDLINCDSEDKEKMIEAVKEKLRWYTFEASEEEFDIGAVDVLVKFLKEVEPKLGKTSEKENDKTEHKQKRRVIELNRGKIAVAVVIGILALTLVSTIVGNSLGISMAWENRGFFRWLQRDKEGQTMITSPEDLGMEDGNVVYYEKIVDVPEEYQKYLMESDKINIWESMNIETIAVEKEKNFQKISEILVTQGKERVSIGVVIFEKKVNLIRDSFDDFEYQYSKEIGKCEYTVFLKEREDGEMEYTILFYENNKEYFVSSQLEIGVVEEITNKYMQHIFIDEK